MKACINKKNCGFTLIELLVVISIIALLLSILMPSLQKVKEQARKIVCASNLRSWGIGLHTYGTEYNDKLPLGGGPTGDVPWSVYRWGWEDPWYGLGDIYKLGIIEEGKAFFCPNSKRDYCSIDYCAEIAGQWYGWEKAESYFNRNKFSPEVHQVYSSFIYLSRWDHAWTGGKPRWKDNFSQSRSNLNKASSGMLIAMDFYEYWMPDDTRTRMLYPPNHEGGTNLLYIDGSVTWEDSQLYFDPEKTNTPYDR